MHDKQNENVLTHRVTNWVAAGFLATFVLSGCGGGGGNGGSGAGSVEYTGNTAAANITDANANEIANETFTGSDAASSSNPTFAASTSKKRTSAYVTSKLLGHVDSLSNAVKGSSSKPAINGPSATVSVDYSDVCPVDGTVQFTGTLDDVTMLGSWTLSFVNCNDGDVIVNGSATLRANAYNFDIDEYTDVELIYDNLHFVSVDPADRIDWQIGANLHAEKIYTGDLNPYTEIATINLTLSENIGGASYKYENYVTEVEYDQYLAPSEALVNVSGRLYHWIHGYVDVETVTSLHYSTVDPLTYPDAGGPLIYTGESNKKIRLTPVSATLVNVSVDTDGDDLYEYSITVPWTALNDDRVNNNAPVANAGDDLTISLGEIAELDGSLSTDADYNWLTFSWEVIDQPVGSNAGLLGADSTNATITPDTAGTYTVELTVYDGWFSTTDTVIVTVN